MLSTDLHGKLWSPNFWLQYRWQTGSSYGCKKNNDSGAPSKIRVYFYRETTILFILKIALLT